MYKILLYSLIRAWEEERGRFNHHLSKFIFFSSPHCRFFRVPSSTGRIQKAFQKATSWGAGSSLRVSWKFKTQLKNQGGEVSFRTLEGPVSAITSPVREKHGGEERHADGSRTFIGCLR